MSEITYIPISGKLGINSPSEALALVQDIWERNRYLRYVQLEPGDFVLDIGANVGIFSLQAANLGANVLAIEPNPETFALLERNIRSNGFISQTSLLNMAVAGYAGEIELAIPESRGLYSMGSATTSNAPRNRLASFPESIMRTVVVGCKTLGEILSESLDKDATIRLMKMDCEGAEWEILNSIDRMVSAKIQNLALETHSGYSEKDLVLRLKELGYYITGFEKRSGVFQTGYVYASRAERENGPPPVEGVVAVLEGPEYAFLGEPVHFDSSCSFGFSQGSANLLREWKIDGEPVTGTESISPVFRKAGIHTVSVRIGSGSLADFSEAVITILEKGYPDPIEEAFRLPAKGKSSLAITRQARCLIPSEYMPKDWTSMGVVISIKRKSPPFDGSGGLCLKFNGSSTEIDKSYSETSLEFAASSLDIHFLLETDRAMEVDISWWFIQSDLEPVGEALIVDENAKTVRLLGPSQKSFLAFKGQMQFIIPREKLPQDWTPELIKIGISLVPVQGEIASPMVGHFEKGGESIELEEWYHMAVIRNPMMDKDTVFFLNIRDFTRLKVVWWCE